jgi:hypothetical protein
MIGFKTLISCMFALSPCSFVKNIRRNGLQVSSSRTLSCYVGSDFSIPSGPCYHNVAVSCSVGAQCINGFYVPSSCPTGHCYSSSSNLCFPCNYELLPYDDDEPEGSSLSILKVTPGGWYCKRRGSKAKCDVDGTFALGCTRYYTCVDGEHTIYHCPPGTYFSNGSCQKGKVFLDVSTPEDTLPYPYYANDVDSVLCSTDSRLYDERNDAYKQYGCYHFYRIVNDRISFYRCASGEVAYRGACANGTMIPFDPSGPFKSVGDICTSGGSNYTKNRVFDGDRCNKDVKFDCGPTAICSEGRFRMIACSGSCSGLSVMFSSNYKTGVQIQSIYDSVATDEPESPVPVTHAPVSTFSTIIPSTTPHLVSLSSVPTTTPSLPTSSTMLTTVTTVSPVELPQPVTIHQTIGAKWHSIQLKVTGKHAVVPSFSTNKLVSITATNVCFNPNQCVDCNLQIGRSLWQIENYSSTKGFVGRMKCGGKCLQIQAMNVVMGPCDSKADVTVGY